MRPAKLPMLALALTLAASSQATAAPGDLDPGFASNGVLAVNPLPSVENWGTAVAVNPSGQIAFTEGLHGISTWSTGLYRLTPTGGADGSATWQSPENPETYDVAIAPDGSMAWAGHGFAADLPTDKATIGGVDANWGNMFVTRVTLPGQTSPLFLGVAIQPDGNVVAAGTNGGDIALARVSSSGALDTNFDGDGIVTGVAGSASDVEIPPGDTDLLVAGTVGGDFALLRFNNDGSADATFDSDGLLTIDLGGSDSAQAMALSGTTATLVGSSGGTAAVVRLVATSPDTTFDSDGLLVSGFGVGMTSASDVGVDAQGRTVILGQAPTGSAMVRLNTGGSLDTTFGSGGVIQAGANDIWVDLAIQSDNDILVAGTNNPGPLQQEPRLWRFQGDAFVPDARFGAIGDDVYSGSGTGQTKLVKVRPGQKAVVSFEIQNDGTASDAFMVTGSASASPFRVTYAESGTDITAAVTGAGDTSTSLAPATMSSHQIAIKAKASAKPRAKKTFTITATSVADPAVSDVIKVKATVT